ncbi:hypothetical protein QF043_005255 [Pseudomonas sp. W3I7]|nr:hypothetical protein [Pseudomonas sp. W3I7]
MSTRPKNNTVHLSESAKVDTGSVQPFTRSQKIYVQGSRLPISACPCAKSAWT